MLEMTSVKERLPEITLVSDGIYGSVHRSAKLLVLVDGCLVTAYYEYGCDEDDNLWSCWFDCWCQRAIDRRVIVTHWMLFPEAPKGAKE